MTNEEIKDSLNRATDILGGMGAVALSLDMSGGAAILAGGLGVAATQTFKDIIHRQLSNKEKDRVVASFAYIASTIRNKLNRGEEPRDDILMKNRAFLNFVNELCEGVLIKCRNQYQEKKIKFISNIVVEFTFDDNISPEIANQILHMAEAFTYQKLCILSFYGKTGLIYDASKLLDAPYLYYENPSFSNELEIIKQDICDLENLGLFKGDIKFYQGDDITPSEIRLTTLGIIFYSLTKLEGVDNIDTDRIFFALQYKTELGKLDKDYKNSLK